LNISSSTSLFHLGSDGESGDLIHMPGRASRRYSTTRPRLEIMVVLCPILQKGSPCPISYISEGRSRSSCLASSSAAKRCRRHAGAPARPLHEDSKVRRGKADGAAGRQRCRASARQGNRVPSAPGFRQGRRQGNEGWRWTFSSSWPDISDTPRTRLQKSASDST
jgi:hypothetical protein